METVVYKVFYYNPRTGDILEYPANEPFTVYADRHFRRRENSFVYLCPPGYILHPKRMVLRSESVKKKFYILGT